MFLQVSLPFPSAIEVGLPNPSSSTIRRDGNVVPQLRALQQEVVNASALGWILAKVTVSIRRIS